MLFDPPLAKGQLIRRYKRFLADIVTEQGDKITVHCPNTGAMHGCNDPGSQVWYSTSDNPKRKYAHTLEAVHTNYGIAGINTGRANALVAQAIDAGVVGELAGYSCIQREAAIPASVEASGRFDFKLTEASGAAEEPCYVEVKSVTYALGGGLGVFPDAVSTRALRHLRALIECRAQQARAVLLFCVQHTGINKVAPAAEVYPEYAQALAGAAAAGVEVLAYSAALSPNEFRLTGALPVQF